MHDLLKSRVVAVMPSYLRLLRAAADHVPPVVADPKASGTWMGMAFAHPDLWAARGAGRTAGDIAVIPIMGLLTLRGSWMGMSLEGIRQTFRAKLDDPNIRAIVLEFDTPGGDVMGVHELATEFRASTKPIVAVANPLSASAGYYLMAQADEILVTPSGEAGSIGVYGGHMDWSRALDQMGITVTLISAGEGKTDGNPFEPLSEEAKATIQADVDRYYGMFVSAVSKGRQVSVDVVRSDWKAKMYGAKDAVAKGLADGVGTYDDAIRRAAAIAQERRATSASVDLEVETRKRARSRSA